MSDKGLSRFSWERAVFDAEGPPPVTRLVLAAIAVLVRKGSAEAWPGIRRLEAMTGLSRPTVLAHIDAAVSAGWLLRRTGQNEDMKRRGSIYTLALPTGKAPLPVGGIETGKPPLPVGEDQAVKLTGETGKADSADRPISREPSNTKEQKEQFEQIGAKPNFQTERNDEAGTDEEEINAEGENQNPKTRLQEDPEPEVTPWHRREAERLGVQRQPGEAAWQYAGRIAREYATRGGARSA